MILAAAKAKLVPYLVPVAVALVAVAGLAFWWLWNDRDALLQKNAKQGQIISNAAQANRENVASIKYLEQDIAWRDQKAIERQHRAELRDLQLSQTRTELQKALQNATDCVNQPWPDAVFDIMRRNTVRDPNRNSTPTRTSGIPAANADTRAGG